MAFLEYKKAFDAVRTVSVLNETKDQEIDDAYTSL